MTNGKPDVQAKSVSGENMLRIELLDSGCVELSVSDEDGRHAASFGVFDLRILRAMLDLVERRAEQRAEFEVLRPKD